MNWFLIVRLLAAHVVGDFLLQSKCFCETKKNLGSQKGWICQVGHSLVQAVLTYLFVGEWGCWMLPLVVFLTHLLLDVGKSALGRDNLVAFTVDQTLHLCVLAGIYTWVLEGNWAFADVNWEKVWVIGLAYFVILVPTAVFIDIFNKRFETEQNGKSLPDGGKNIGYLERILIVSFILSGWLEGIGYLLAAKSVFRFGDLKNNKELKHTEYVLVGTLLSFTVAVIVGLVTKCIMSRW